MRHRFRKSAESRAGKSKKKRREGANREFTSKREPFVDFLDPLPRQRDLAPPGFFLQKGPPSLFALANRGMDATHNASTIFRDAREFGV